MSITHENDEKDVEIIEIDADILRKYHQKKRLQVLFTILNLIQFVDKPRLMEISNAVDDMCGSEIDQLRDEIVAYNKKHNPYSCITYYQGVKKCLLEQLEHPVESFSAGPILLTDVYSKTVVSDMASRYPTDRFCLDAVVLDELKSFWHGTETSDMDCFVSSDIFFAKQVAVLDMEIFLTKEVAGQSVVYESRIQIDENYASNLDNLDMSGKMEDSSIAVGYLELRIPCVENKGFVFQFGVVQGFDTVILDERNAHYGFTDEELSDFVKYFTLKDVITLCTKHLQTWYTIQMALLHPVVSQLFVSGNTMKDKRRKLLGHKMVKINRRLRFNKVTMEDVVRIRENNPMIRKTMAWYVMGHWRTCKSGKVTFVAPYWKGPLKDMKSALDTRVRVIDDVSLQDLRKDGDSDGKKEKVNEEKDN